MGAAAIDHRVHAAPKQVLQHLHELNHIALKGHQLVEESLERIIAQHCRAASVLNDVRMSFYIKMTLARALVGDLHEPALWALVWRLYLIYIDVAHKVKSPRVSELIKNLIEEKARWVEEPLPSIENDDQLASSFVYSIEYVLGALAVIELEARVTSTRGRLESR